MLATYQAKLINNQIHWIDTPPQSHDELYVAITVLPKEIQTNKPKRQIPSILKGLGTQHGDIINNDEMIADWIKEHD